MFTIKSCFTILQPPACDLVCPAGLLPDVRGCACWGGGDTGLFRQREKEGKKERHLLVLATSISVDFSCLSILTKGPLQMRSRQGCHLLANMLSVIFCALGLLSGAGPHGSLAHANRTNPSRTCLSVSLSSISPPPLPAPLLFSAFARQCVSLSCLFALSSISLFVHLFPPSLFLSLSRSSLSLSQKTVLGLCVS